MSHSIKKHFYHLIGSHYLRENLSPIYSIAGRMISSVPKVLRELDVPSIDLISDTHFQEICPPLLKQEITLSNKTYENLDNFSLHQYFSFRRNGECVFMSDKSHRVMQTRMRMFCTAFSLLDETFEKLSFTDLACSLGYFTFQANKMGFASTLGVDARTEHKEQFKTLKKLLQIDNSCDFKLQDLSQDTHIQQTDVLLCAGLLYHLTDHVGFLQALRNSTKKMLILDTSLNGKSDDTSTLVFEDKHMLRKAIKGIAFDPSLRNVINLLRWVGFKEIYHIQDTRDARELAYLSGKRITLVAR